METKRPYVKGASINAFSGTGRDAAAVLVRVRDLAARIHTVEADAYRKTIVACACRGLLGESTPEQPSFELQPHVVDELARITDDELPRYLFYRYRYDVYPRTYQLDAFPPCVQVEPTSICNYRCVFCYQTDRSFTQGRSGHMGQMSLDMFRRVVDEIEGNVEAVTLASRGEPLLCKQIDQMLGYVRGKFLGFKINTNAWYLDERKAHAILEAEPNTLVFSADAADPDLYARLRVRGELQRVLDNVRQFAEIRAKHYPNSRTLTRVSGVEYTSEQNFAEVESFWHDYVDQVAFVAYNPWESAYDVPANGLAQPCSDLWRRAFVWWDGQVNPCDVDYKSALSAGKIGSATLSDLWRGEAYEGLRQSHLLGNRQSLSPCKGCVLI